MYHRPTASYSLQRFLAARPDEDANVIFAREAVYGSTRETRALQPDASATWTRANSVYHNVQPQKSQAPETPRFQAAGTGIISPTRTPRTHTPRLELEAQSLGFSLRTFLASDPADDANASYGRITLNEAPGNYCSLMQILKEFEGVMGSDGNVGCEKKASCEKMSCEKSCEGECYGYGIRNATALRQNFVTSWLDQLRIHVVSRETRPWGQDLANLL